MLETLEHTINAAVIAQQNMALSVQKELRARSGTKFAVQGKIVDLRETRALTRVRMRSCYPQEKRGRTFTNDEEIRDRSRKGS